MLSPESTEIVGLGQEMEEELADAEQHSQRELAETSERSLPPIEEQRRIVRDLQEKHNDDYAREGARVFFLAFAWFDLFMNGDVQQYPLGQITTTDIHVDNGVFCDSSYHQLATVIPPVFEQLVEWYGLSPGSRPVITSIVEIAGFLKPEYSLPTFQLHYLLMDPPHYTSYASVPTITVSQLNTCQDLVQQCIKTLDEREHLSKSVGFENSKFRVWVISSENMDHLKYQLDPDTFLTLESKVLLGSQLLDSSLKNVNLRLGHLVIEQKQIYRPSVSGSLAKTMKYWPANFRVHFPPTPSDGRMGLQNLGNTCYMNSALQCLVHIPELTHYFLFDCHYGELNEDNPLGMDGKVANAFAQLIHQLFDKKTTKSNYCSPREFKSMVGHYNSMFSGYHQQDSQEFLAFLLDGLHEDLNRIMKKPFTENVELDEKDVEDIEKIKELAEKSWQNHKLRNDSIVIDLFVGLYKSTLECPVCGKISITFDPFSDLTLPLPVENYWSGTIELLLEDGPLRSFDVELPKNATYTTLKNYVATKLNLNTNDLITVEVWQNQFHRNLEDSESRSGYLPISDLISPRDKMIMYEVKHSEGDLIVPVLNTVNPPSNIPDSFGIPFFISLNDQERKSFGAIREKLQHRYEQLSTFKYFSKVRSNQGDKVYHYSDFPLLKHAESVESGYESDVSMATPDLSGDYAFSIKVFDSSKEIRYRRRGHYTRNTASSPVEKAWTPMTSNNFTRLPKLLDSLSEKKKAYYTYAKKLDIDTTTESSTTAADISLDSSNDNDHVNAEDIVSDSAVKMVDGHSPSIESLAGPIDLPLLPDTDADDSSPEIRLEPLTVDSDTVETTTLLDIDGDAEIETPLISEDLIKEKTALVCEWDPDHFDIFFSGLEEDGEGGKETWSTPEVLINEEIVELQRQRASKADHRLSLDQCLKLFSRAEVLGENDLWFCSRCNEHRQATKQIQIWSTPDILTIQLKRFENQRSFSDKIDAVVDFPIEGLDMSPYLALPTLEKDGVIYDLFAVDNHYGGIGGGHYTSYVKNFVDNSWCHYDDSHVTQTSPEEVVTRAAYLLFYRKRSLHFLGGDALKHMLEQAREQYDEREKLVNQAVEAVYRQTEDDDDDDFDDDEDEDEDDADKLNRNSSDDISSRGVAPTPSSTSSATGELSQEDPQPLDVVDNSSDLISSVAVGVDDEEDGSSNSSRRKQRLLSRGGVKSSSDSSGEGAHDDDVVVESPALAGSPISLSDDDCSTYSSADNFPSGMTGSGHAGSVNSPRPLC